jgi:hypothetical protein
MKIMGFFSRIGYVQKCHRGTLTNLAKICHKLQNSGF